MVLLSHPVVSDVATLETKQYSGVVLVTSYPHGGKDTNTP